MPDHDHYLKILQIIWNCIFVVKRFKNYLTNIIVLSFSGNLNFILIFYLSLIIKYGIAYWIAIIELHIIELHIENRIIQIDILVYFDHEVYKESYINTNLNI